MNMQEYFTLFPDAKVWRYQPERKRTKKEKLSPKKDEKIVEGMLEFDESAYYLAQPFNEKYGYFDIQDAREMLYYDVKPLEEVKKKMLLMGYNFPRRLQLGIRSELSEHRANILLQQLTVKELRQMHEQIEDSAKTYYTLEKPIGFRVCGNDDATYTKFFGSADQALEELKLLESCQPLNMKKDLIDNGFVFTN